MQLSVNEPFLGHQRGDRITDPETVQAILESEHAGFVVQVDDSAPHFPQE